MVKKHFQLDSCACTRSYFPNVKNFGKAFMLGQTLDDGSYPMQVTGAALLRDQYDEGPLFDNKRSIRDPLDPPQVDDKEDGAPAL